MKPMQNGDWMISNCVHDDSIRHSRLRWKWKLNKFLNQSLNYSTHSGSSIIDLIISKANLFRWQVIDEQRTNNGKFSFFI